MTYCMYLRKSRKDMEAELHGEGETLRRHERLLLQTAEKLTISVAQIYKEIVSGETIAARPVMQKLLLEVEQGLWEGVLVVEIERLARGDTRDQGYVAEAFTYSNTKIITPIKIYDPCDPSDQEYFEFSLFMSRREYKTINRRLESGRLSAFREGCFLGNIAPYGWQRYKLPNRKGYSLKPDPAEALALKLMYLWSGYGCDDEILGTSRIARKLNSMGITPRNGNTWTPTAIREIIANEHNLGMVRRNYRKTQCYIENGIVRKKRPRAREYLLADGLHDGQITKELFDLANSNLRNGAPRLPESYQLKNPLAGIIVCSECHRKMIRRANTVTYKYETLNCVQASGCKTVGSPLFLVEHVLLQILKQWFSGYEMNSTTVTTHITEGVLLKQKLLADKIEALNKITGQRDHLYDLLEQGIYTTDVFLKRSGLLEEKFCEINSHITTIQKELENEEHITVEQASIIPNSQYLINHYNYLSVENKNKMLHNLLEKVEYKKLEKSKKGCAEIPNFELHIYPKLPGSP